MTTNPTIDGVPRELRPVLAMILNALDRDAMDGKAVRGEMAQELRALLGAPAPRAEFKKIEMAHVMNALEDVRGGPALTSNQCHDLARALNDSLLSPLQLLAMPAEYLAAAQPQGGASPDVTHFAIQVEKLLCEALRREWAATGISIESLVSELKARAGAGAEPHGEPVAFQARVKPWLLECFGESIASDQQERNHRFLEEALELVQACGCTATEAHQLVEYVYGRPVGEPSQEVGGVMVTMAALCLAHGMDMHAAGEAELARIWTKVEQIRAKQAAKPAMSPLPGAYPKRSPQ